MPTRRRERPATTIAGSSGTLPTGRREASLRAAYERHAGNGSNADAVYQALVDEIVSGALAQGWHLVEEHLAALFDVSRTPVREALMRLENEHLAERDRRRGLVVGYVTGQQIIDVYVIREALDGIAASLAARYGSPIDIAELEHINELMARAAKAKEFTRMAQLNIEFHAVLARASRNQMLQRFVHDIHRWVQRVPATTLAEPGRGTEAIAEHQRLIDALKANDATLAEQAARTHIRDALAIRMRIQARMTPRVAETALTSKRGA
ncbi:MAG TPA: GntR family transcriptional regulator [Candidatus Limnocylindrales bacterium]|nr:GntR family transcriptional regulator [Candidatus Limnocylindrales bacterium]